MTLDMIFSVVNRATLVRSSSHQSSPERQTCKLLNVHGFNNIQASGVGRVPEEHIGSIGGMIRVPEKVGRSVQARYNCREAWNCAVVRPQPTATFVHGRKPCADSIHFH